MKHIIALFMAFVSVFAFADHHVKEYGNTQSVYFDYDSHVVKQEFLDTVIADKAAWLAEDANRKIRIEAFADDRGTHHYNLGLTQRRAQAVSSALKAKGASSSQIEIAFYSEEYAKPGHCDDCWQENRRADIKELVK